jgi:hypothetical protein
MLAWGLAGSGIRISPSRHTESIVAVDEAGTCLAFNVEEEVPDSLASLLLIGVELIEALKAYVKKHAITFVSRELSLQPACQSLVWRQ